MSVLHDEVMSWKRLPRYWPFAKWNPAVRGGFPSQGCSNADWMFVDDSPMKLLNKQLSFSDLKWHHAMTLVRRHD